MDAIHEPYNQSGFTLLELILVLTLMAIITSMIVPVYTDSLDSARAEHAVSDIASLVQYAQERAMTDSTRYRFYFDTESQEYWIMRLENIDGQMLFREVTERQAERRTLPGHLQGQMPDGLEDPDSDARFIEFFPNGSSDAVEIRIMRDNHSELRLDVTGKLGQVEVSTR